MPNTLLYRPTLIDGLITNERLSSYKAVFHPSTDVELMGVYLWNAYASGAIYPIIGAAEVTLRNAIDGTLRTRLGEFWWKTSRLLYRSYVPGRTAAPPVVVNLRKKFEDATKSFKTEQKKRYGAERAWVTHHGVVAKTDFGTWQYLLHDEFMGNNLIWPSCLSSTFAGAWPSSQASKVLLHARELVSAIREFRNRLFHHEPAWKAYDVHTEAQALHHLKEKVGKIESLLALIHPENLKLLDRNGLLEPAHRACTSHEIRRFQHLTQTYTINSLSKLRYLVDQCGTDNTVLTARLHGGQRRIFLINPG